ncbi:hypothetical protein [Sorangium sp. So ce1097]|uniref:hypothetical protein n=1 Tax=Sorangium sp. So ce1097 TaxID=3133330 RepID=UPI003F62CD3E
MNNWPDRLRPRDSLIRRGQATALGIQLVKNKLRTINADLREQLLARTPPVGFGTPSELPSREDELLDCLYELREMIVTLQFHLGIDDLTELPSHVPITRSPEQSSSVGTTSDHHTLLNGDNATAGKIALVGLVNRYSSAVFSDHHGLLIHAQIDGKPDLKIYYQSLDATSQFSGSTAVRSMGSMLPFTGQSSHGTSLRGAVGFTEQFIRLKSSNPEINVIILAEVGLQDARQLLEGNIGSGWEGRTNNLKDASGVNDITMLYKSDLKLRYSFDVKTSDLGNAAWISCDQGQATCTLLGCHILNSKAKNKTVGDFMKTHKISALFGDTNMSTTGSSLGHGFNTVESHNSVTDSLEFGFSNSASNKMFDKLLVRTRSG